MGYLNNAGLSYFFGKLKTTFAPISHGHGGATQSAAGFMSAADKKKLDGIAEGANKYSLPTATSSVLGGVKTGANITNSSGSISVTKANVVAALGYTPPTQDTNTWRPVVNGLNSTATDQSLAAAQGKILNESKAAMIVLTNQNLNDVTTPGFYSSGGGNTVTNKPSNVDYFGLIVIHRATGSYYTQIVYTDSTAYRRHCVNGTWSGWVQDKLTDTDTWRGVQNNLTSTATDQSLSAAQGKVLKNLIDGKAPASHTHSQYYDSTISRTKGTVLAAPASADGGATFRTLTKSDVGLGSVDNTADSAKSVKYATSAGSATKATNDTKDQAITSYIRGLSVSGRTITFTKGDGTTGTITTQDNNTTYSNMTAATASAAGKAGLVPAPGAGSQVKFLRGDGTWATPTNTTYSAFKGATSSAAGGTGLVPAPGTGNVNQFLKGDGTWGTPSNTWRGIQNNLTSDSTNDSLAAAQGKALKALIDGKATSSHTHTKSQITDFPALGTAAARNVRTLTAQGASGWKDAATDQQYVPDMAFMAYWNGAYSGTASNLAYCNRGAFGTIVTKSTNDYAVAGHTHNYAGSSSAGGAATSANKVNNALTINLNGTSQGAWDGSSAKSISITAASVGATSVTISRW